MQALRKTAARSRMTVLAGIAALAVVGGCSAPVPNAVAPATEAASTAARTVDPEEFAEILSTGTLFVLNVHIPDEGSIPGTTSWIAFDQLTARLTQLPTDRSTRLAVYCKTGRMSAEAVVTLAKLGYTDIVELRGGMLAWAAQGRPLDPPRS